MTTGQRIKAARIKAGYTQSQLARELNIPYQSIGQWERDLRNPKQDSLIKIAKVLGVHLRDLIDASMWEEFDRNVNTEPLRKEYDIFEKILNELGYIVEIYSIPLITHQEEVIDSEEKLLGTSNIVDKEKVQWNVSGNGISVSLSETDFERLKTSTSDLINSFLWQKSQENK